jgi:catechol 2,3-dioxygenase-like lactoylglutathione lyase family enzyme
MPYHHLAITTRDMPATHTFYAEAMGFRLVRVEKAQMGPNKWAKHFFYDTGDGSMIAFWDIRDAALKDYQTSISAGLGLPNWSNHIAFGAASMDDLNRKRERLVNAGYPVTEIDHNWCTSIYAMDPNGIMVEFCVTTHAFDVGDSERALAAVYSDQLRDEPPPKGKRYDAVGVAKAVFAL